MRRALRPGLPLVLALALAACDAPTVPASAGAYPFALQTPSGDLVMHWAAGATVRIYVAPGGSEAASLGSALSAGAAAWNAAALFGEYRLEPVGRPGDADAVLAGSDAPLPVDVGSCAPSLDGLAVTTFCLTPDGRSLQTFPLTAGNAGPSHVVFVVTVLASLAADPASARRVVAHELGHVLGLARHSTSAADLMFRTPAVERPSAADAATVQLLYHTPAAVVP